jgi:hypothetical protein
MKVKLGKYISLIDVEMIKLQKMLKLVSLLSETEANMTRYVCNVVIQLPDIKEVNI